MNNVFTFNRCVTGAGVISMACWAIVLFAPDVVGHNPLKGMDMATKPYLKAVGRNCFNPIPLLNDQTSCDISAAQYVRVASGLQNPDEDVLKQVRNEVSLSLGGKARPQSSGESAE